MSKPGLRAIIWCAVSTKSQQEDDKFSLPQQETDAHALCERENWQIIDVMRVPGHSRRYVDIHECAADMRAQGIDAFDRLMDHWRDRDFDVLIVRDGDRFARTQTLHAYVTEMTIDMSNARIYSLADGWIDEKNYRMWIAMSGYKAASHIDFLRQAHATAYDAKVSKGIAMSSTPPWSHEDVRDPATGKRIGLRVKPGLERLWQDAAEVFLRGIAWQKMGFVLRDEYGLVHPDTGKAFSTAFFRNLFYRPAFWGNSGRRFDRSGKQKRGLWCFDPSVPLPEGSTIVYGTHDPVYTGELAARVQAEMRRRVEIRGNASPVDPYRFSGLLVCADCGYHMVGQGRANASVSIYYRCMTNYKPEREIECASSQFHILEAAVSDWVDARLRDMFEVGNNAAFQPDSPDTGESSLDEQIVSLEEEITRTEDTLRRLILRQAQTEDPTLADAFNTTIYETSERIRAMNSRLLTLRQQQPSLVTRADQRRASEQISALSISDFWKLPDREINQMLRRLLGDVRLVMENGEITGLIDRRALD